MPDPELTRQFEDQGPEVVRARLHHMVPWAQMEAVAWLAQKDRESRESADASTTEQIALAREAKDAACAANFLAKRSVSAAEKSNNISIAALVVAIIAMVASVISLMHH